MILARLSFLTSPTFLSSSLYGPGSPVNALVGTRTVGTRTDSDKHDDEEEEGDNKNDGWSLTASAKW
jgi:hypothetical protein